MDSNVIHRTTIIQHARVSAPSGACITSGVRRSDGRSGYTRSLARMVESVDTGDSRWGLPRGNARVRNRVNSGKPKARGGSRAMAILSQAAEGSGSAEGAETSGVSPNDTPRPRAPGTRRAIAMIVAIARGEEIVRAGGKSSGKRKILRRLRRRAGSSPAPGTPPAAPDPVSLFGLLPRGLGGSGGFSVW